jgi:leucyl-tRNA synthetase
LKRIWHFAHTHQTLIQQADTLDIVAESPHIETLAEVHTLLAAIARDINKQQLNTVASGAMKLFQVLQKIPADNQHAALLRYVFTTLLQVINPVTPHISHTLWQELALSSTPIEKSVWPEPKEDIMAACRVVQLTVQINGKTKGQISVDGSQDEASMLRLLTSHDKYAAFFVDKTVKKTILVPNKLISVVLA